MKDMKYKKGFEIKALAGLGVTFVVIAIVLSFGGTILGDLQDTNSETATQTINNETISTLISGTPQELTQSGRWGWTGDCVLVSVYNATDGLSESIPIANFSITSPCSFGWAIPAGGALNDLVGNGSGFNVTYTQNYNTGETAYNTTGDGLSAVDTFSGWLPTLALIVVAAVIIGIIVRYFMIGGSSEY